MSVFALVDCNNFFASCERVFDPTLKDKPIGILSNNDGCVISRSNELKKLGCKMGEPYFKCRDFERRGAVFLSSNYQLYGDMSKRVMSLLKQYVEDMEIYSIDEAFLKLDGVSDPQGFCQTLRSIILRGTGIPVSIGIASTKTLAKAANAKAKKGEGVFNLLDETKKDDLLKTLDVEDIWGISKGLGKRLKGMGLYTAYDLMEAPLKKIRKAFSVVVERMVLELRGFSTLSLNEVSDKKSIRCSRSFGEVVTDQEILTQSLINFCVRAVQKLRDQGSLVRYLSFYVRSSPFKTHESF